MFHVNKISQNFVKANAMLCKFWHFVKETTLQSIYYAILHSHLSYVCTVWGQGINQNYQLRITGQNYWFVHAGVSLFQLYLYFSENHKQFYRMVL